MKISQTVSELWGIQLFFGGKKLKGHNLEKGEQSCLLATHRLYLIHIPTKFHEDIPNSYRVMRCTRMKITQNKHKKQLKGHNSETKKPKATTIVGDTS